MDLAIKEIFEKKMPPKNCLVQMNCSPKSSDSTLQHLPDITTLWIKELPGARTAILDLRAVTSGRNPFLCKQLESL